MLIYKIFHDPTTPRRAALAHLLTAAGEDPSAPLRHHPSGQPYFPSLPHLHISISHCPPYTAYALSSAPLGIDLEAPEKLRDPLALARRFFDPAEAHAVASSPAPLTAALTLLTQKEAYTKLLSLPLAQTLHSPLPPTVTFTPLTAPPPLTLTLCQYASVDAETVAGEEGS